MTAIKTPKGTVHERVWRKSPIGRRVPVLQVPAPNWHDLTVGHQPPIGGHHDPMHPSRKHDVPQPAPVLLPNPEPLTGLAALLTRRERRRLGRLALKAGLA